MENLILNKIDLAFGNSVAVRQSFLETTPISLVAFGLDRLAGFDYQDRTGDPELTKLTKQVIERQTGRKYKYVLLTNGATGGVVISLRMFKQSGYTTCNTRAAPYYLRYPGMIKASGLIHCDESYFMTPHHNVILQDIPSNPLTKVNAIHGLSVGIPTVLDAVYLNRVYSGRYIDPQAHDIAVGSYSKLLGLSSLRIGWIATNDALMYERLKELVTAEYCCLSKADTVIAKATMRDLDWDKFETLARFRLDCNREEFSKLSKFFDKEVPDIGMFLYTQIDSKFKELLEKSEILWTTGSSLGTNDDFGRFNIGQDPGLIKKAVKTIIKNDKVK